MTDAIKLDVILCAVIVASSAPLWRAQISDGKKGVPIAFMLVLVSAALQLMFANLISIGHLQVLYSAAFAAIGVPCCIVALILALRDTENLKRSDPVVISAIIELAIWLVFVSLH